MRGGVSGKRRAEGIRASIPHMRGGVSIGMLTEDLIRRQVRIPHMRGGVSALGRSPLAHI